MNDKRKKSSINMENKLDEDKVAEHQDPISHSFSYDGYERLHDDAMDRVSVSIYCSEEGTSRNNLTTESEKQEKKMKISLSQEQLKLKCENKKFLSVPTNNRRSSSFSTADKIEGRKCVRISSETFPTVETNVEKMSEHSTLNESISLTPPRITTSDVSDDEIIYAVPRKASPESPWLSRMKKENRIKTSSASSLPAKSDTTAQTSSTAELSTNFKHPLFFYCKICNNILSDPRTLDCLHSFCVQCLARLDATNNLQNNQFWRKISDSSSCKLNEEEKLGSVRGILFKFKLHQCFQVLNLIRRDLVFPGLQKLRGFSKTRQA